MTCDMWHPTHDMWHATCDMWHVLGGEHSLKFQLPSSYCLWFMILWRSGGKGWLTYLHHCSNKLTQIFAYAIFRLQAPLNGKICKIALGNISWNKSYWHECSLLIIVRVTAKAITDQWRLHNIFLAVLLKFCWGLDINPLHTIERSSLWSNLVLPGMFPVIFGAFGSRN